MGNTSDLQIWFDFIQKVWLFLTRSVVQVQLLVIGVAFVVAWVLMRGAKRQLRNRFLAWVEGRFSASPNSKGGRRRLWRHLSDGLSVIPEMTFLLSSIGLLSVASYLFVEQGWFAGLLEDAMTLLSAILLYCVLMGLLYILFGRNAMRPYNYRLLTPLLALFLGNQVLKKNLIDLNLLAESKLFDLFDSPIRAGGLFIATVGLYFWINIAWAIQHVLHHVFTARTKADPGAVEAFLTIFRYLMTILGVLIALSSLGLNSTTVAAITGGLSVGIGFGLREVLANFISGLLLLFERSLRPGDIVQIGSEMGVVQELSIRSTRVCTNNNVEIIVPNQKFLTSTVTTYTKSDRLVRILLPVRVSYNSDPEEVRELLLAIAHQHQEVQKEPPPAVFFAGLGESNLDFQLGVWLQNPKRIKALTSDLYFMIFKAFNTHHIQIPHPQRDLHIKSTLSQDVLNLLTKNKQIAQNGSG